VAGNSVCARRYRSDHGSREKHPPVPRPGSCRDAQVSSVLEGYRHSASAIIASSGVQRPDVGLFVAQHREAFVVGDED
jgi:hypothetical protein